MFLAAEKGKLVQFAGKELSEINIAGDEEIESSSDDSDCDDAEVDDGLPLVENASRAAETVTSSAREPLADETESEQPKKAKLERETSQECSGKKRRKSAVKRKWTEEEKDSIAVHFATDILNKRLPGKAAIDTFTKKYGIDRKWTNVKDYIRNMYFK